MKNQKSDNKKAAKRARIAFTDAGWEDYQFWQTEDAKKLAKINELIDACLADPLKGIGKPEPLKGNLSGLWSRRIDREHRLVYTFESETLCVVACRYHY